jgi:hypothetical protein
MFDWSLTHREIVLFVPNYGRGQYIRRLAPLLRTALPRNEWVMLVANDGIHEDFSDLAPYNVVSFTLERPPGERNGAFIRNYVIKRCQSRILFAKDPEVLIAGDFLSDAVSCDPAMWRTSVPHRLSEQMTMTFLSGQELDILNLAYREGNPVEGSPFYWHWGMSVRTRFLRDLRGYDEDFERYGCEDVDMYRRLKDHGVPEHLSSIPAIHLWHPISSHLMEDDRTMNQLLVSKTGMVKERNSHRDWGNG